MKNQYFGDIGDYGKYAMLRYLADNNINIAVNWYLTEDDDSNDGKFLSYLNKTEMRHYDSELFYLLKDMVSEGKRSVIEFENKCVIKNARYYNAILTDDKSNRSVWHENALKACKGSDLVFLDPDTGTTEKKRGKGSSKYCFPEEIADYYHAGQNVVYYCQKARRKPEQWIDTKNLMKKYLPDCRIFVITYRKGTRRSYIFILHEDSYKQYASLLKNFCMKWFGVFGEERLDTPIALSPTGQKFQVTNSKGIEMTIEEMEDGTVKIKRSDKPNMTSVISIDFFMELLK